MTTRRPLLPVALVAALALAGCAPTGAPDDGRIHVVASTNVYGSIASAVAGDAAEVTAILDDPTRDPHEYEASSRDALAIADAELVIVNGGGYDDFMDTLLDAHGTGAEVIDVVELSGLASADQGADGEGEFNEHVWYDLPTVGLLANRLADELAELAPEHADDFRANAATFLSGIDELGQRAATIAAAHDGDGVAVTEPVPLYLLEACGLVNLTPAEFSEAIEEGTDAPVLVLEQMLALVVRDDVALLGYNEQTVGPQTEQVLAAAQTAGTPVVSFSELLPDGLDYLGWMGANLDAIENALG